MKGGGLQKATRGGEQKVVHVSCGPTELFLLDYLLRPQANAPQSVAALHILPFFHIKTTPELAWRILQAIFFTFMVQALSCMWLLPTCLVPHPQADHTSGVAVGAITRMRPPLDTPLNLPHNPTGQSSMQRDGEPSYNGLASRSTLWTQSADLSYRKKDDEWSTVSKQPMCSRTEAGLAREGGILEHQVQGHTQVKKWETELQGTCRLFFHFCFCVSLGYSVCEETRGTWHLATASVGWRPVPLPCACVGTGTSIGSKWEIRCSEGSTAPA